MDSKEIKPVNPKGNQPWTFTGRTEAEAEASTLWPLDKSQLMRKDLILGKIKDREENGETEDEMVGWHHRINGHEFEQALGVGDGQRSLLCCSPRGCKESDRTEWLNDKAVKHAFTRNDTVFKFHSIFAKIKLLSKHTHTHTHTHKTKKNIRNWWVFLMFFSLLYVLLHLHPW